MVTEQQIQEGLQTVLLTITGTFDAGDVVINDEGILDGETANAPYAIIGNSEVVPGLQETLVPTGVFEIPVSLVVRFTDTQASNNAFRNARQAVIDKFNEVGSNRSLGGIGSVTVKTIRTNGGIKGLYGKNAPAGHPIFITQDLIFEVEIWG